MIMFHAIYVNVKHSMYVILFTFLFFFFGGRHGPQWARASSFVRFLYHTQQRTTVGRTPLDK